LRAISGSRFYLPEDSRSRSAVSAPPSAFVVRNAMASDDELGDFQIRFQQAHGARLFRQGKPRALLEVKSPDIPTAIYEARLRGYDRAAAKERASQVEKK
jgi:hypothetical protein